VTRPQQAAILCGGIGSRLRPLTDTLPKPLAPVNGRPFLAYLVDQLRVQGIQRIVLLTGYRGEMIRAYVGDGAAFGVRIDYSHGPAEWETGRRVWEARATLDERCLLLYSDNYVPFSLDKLMARHSAAASAITALLQPKSPGNIRLGADGGIALYDPSRSAPGLDHVEIGYMVIARDLVLAELAAQPDFSFSRVLEDLTTRGSVAGLVSRDPYHSISDPVRWRRAERYLAPKRIVLIDRDGTINRRPPRGEYVTGWDRFEWIEGTVAAMRQLAAVGFRFIVLSNQAGIGRGSLDAAVVDEINRRMVAELAASGVEVMDVYVCPHHWDARCSCRKPEPGLFFRAAATHLVRMDRTMYVGDDPRDARAAFNAECLSVLVGPDRHEDPGGGARPAFVSETLLDAVPWMVSQFESWERTDGVTDSGRDSGR
jgi:histidinol-phosphate phosphatase family protein